MWPNPQKTADLVTFTEEILNGKLHFLCSALKTANHGKSSELNHGCIKPGFTTVNYYTIDRPINFVLKAACLWTQYVIRFLSSN